MNNGLKFRLRVVIIHDGEINISSIHMNEMYVILSFRPIIIVWLLNVSSQIACCRCVPDAVVNKLLVGLAYAISPDCVGTNSVSGQTALTHKINLFAVNQWRIFEMDINVYPLLSRTEINGSLSGNNNQFIHRMAGSNSSRFTMATWVTHSRLDCIRNWLRVASLFCPSVHLSMSHFCGFHPHTVNITFFFAEHWKHAEFQLFLSLPSHT